MVLFNHSTRELTAKIVYYGPGLCGKTTNLKVLHDRLEKGTAGRLLSLATAQDRTIYFDLLPVELGNIKGYTVRFQLCTVPGQVFYNETRKLVLRGVDGIVFVVDSQWSMLSHNLESFQNLKENLREADISLDGIPLVVQYNKRDLSDVLSVDALQESLAFESYPFVEAVAADGRGVVETFKLISKLTFVDLLRRLQKSGGLGDLPASALSRADAEEGDETFVRAGPRPEKRSSFVADAPFETSAPWPAPVTNDEVFDTTAAPTASPVASPAASAAEPFDDAEVPPSPAASGIFSMRPAAPPAAASASADVAVAVEPSGVEEAAPAPSASAAAPPAPVAPRPATPPVPHALEVRLRTLEEKLEGLEALARQAAKTEDLAALKSELASDVGSRLETANRAGSDSLDPVRAEVGELRKALASQSERHEGALSAEREAADQRLSVLRADIGTLGTDTRSEVNRLSAELTSVREELKGKGPLLEEAISTVRQDLERLRGTHAEELASARATIGSLESTLGSLKSDLGSLPSEVRQALSGLSDALASEGRRREELAGALGAQLSNLDGEISRLKAGRDDEKGGLLARITSLEEEVRKALADLDDAHKKHSERLAASESKTRSLLDALKRAVSDLE